MKVLFIAVVAFAFCNSVSAELRVETARVPMRDGVKLATDVYRDDAFGPAPVVLMRTPYDRTKQKANAERYVAAGYVVVMQDLSLIHI